LRIFKDDLRFDVSPTKVSLIEEISFLSEENSTGKVETKIKNFKLHPILSAEAYILLDLSEIPGHPRALKERISKKSQGTINPGEATFYAAKKRLEQKKLIRMVRLEKQEHAGRPRQWYELTDTGRGQVRQIKLILSQFLKNFPKMGG
jgi:DNA-binding PadR family transcriptional regulator